MNCRRVSDGRRAVVYDQSAGVRAFGRWLRCTLDCDLAFLASRLEVSRRWTMQRILRGSVITMLATDGKDKIEPTLAESSADAARIASPAGLSARVAMGTAAAPASALVVANREEN